MKEILIIDATLKDLKNHFNLNTPNTIGFKTSGFYGGETNRMEDYRSYLLQKKFIYIRV